MDPSSLSGQFSTSETSETFPRIVHIPTTMEAARLVHENNDWSGVMDEKERIYRNPEILVHNRTTNPEPGHDPHKASMDWAYKRAVTDAHSVASEDLYDNKNKYYKEASAYYRANRSLPETNNMGSIKAPWKRPGFSQATADSGVVIEAILHPSNPVHAPLFHGKHQVTKTADVANQGADVWDTTGEHETDESLLRILDTSALTFRGIMGPFPQGKKKKTNE
jgi:hypothetical protein